MRKISFITTIVALAAVLCSCSKQDDFETVIMTPDPQHPDLPIYSELGYNTVGAYYNGDAWVSDRSALTAGVAVYNDSLYFMMAGKTYPMYNTTQLVFVLTPNTTTSIENLTNWNNHSIDLSQAGYQVKLKDNSGTYVLSNVKGKLELKRCRRLIVDSNSFVGVIMSGTFNFTGNKGSENVEFSNGRFDITITSTRFQTNSRY